ncbi:MAG: DUF4386 domain-containing protein [Nitriliruptoraceae bacterium]|nr:DUF4386 domain-containing protein [Nitriliruptoraceae bacterium]
MTTPTRLARLAGVLYLCMCVLGAFAHLWVRAGVHVPGDATATVANLVADPTMFRLALVADIAMATAFVGVGVALFRLLRTWDRHAAVAMLIFVAVGAGMILTNLVLHQAALLVATDATASAVGSDELVLLLLDLHGHGYALAGIFFGLWLLPIGVVGYRARLFPRPLSVLLLVAGGCWIVDTLLGFLLPELPAAVHTVIQAPTVAEFWLVAYLLIRGVRTPTPERLAPQPLDA